MRTLVIHPEDPSTDFLGAIYQGLECTLISEYTEEHLLIREMEKHDRILALGHGSSWGLLGWGDYAFLWDAEQALMNKPHNLYIWCDADDFVRWNGLQGFYTGMFISEVEEASRYQIETTQAALDYSNELFARVVGEGVRTFDPQKIWAHVKSRYASVDCPVIQYNAQRVYWSQTTSIVG